MSYTYATFVTALATELVVDPTDTDFLAILPTIIDQAEQRCYRELDLLNTVTRDSAPLTASNRNFTLPQNNGRFVVTNGINIITPSSTTSPDNGSRNQCTPITRDFLDMAWPSSTGASVPVNYAMITDQTLIFGPWPDAPYTVEVIGTIRPNPLSASNTTSYLSLYLPDLFFDASMIAGAAYQKNFGSMADNPQMAASWSTEYDKHFASANVEEMRKKYAAGAWGSLQPTPIATPSR